MIPCLYFSDTLCVCPPAHPRLQRASGEDDARGLIDQTSFDRYPRWFSADRVGDWGQEAWRGLWVPFQFLPDWLMSEKSQPSARLNLAWSGSHRAEVHRLGPGGEVHS